MMSLRVRLLLLLLLVVPMLGQDLNDAWQAYMSTNTRISQLKAERGYYANEQIVIKNTVDHLQKGSERTRKG